MNKYEYRVTEVKGPLFWHFMDTEALECECEKLGQHGWELVAVKYKWFSYRYILFFKRIKQIEPDNNDQTANS